ASSAVAAQHWLLNRSPLDGCDHATDGGKGTDFESTGRLSDRIVCPFRPGQRREGGICHYFQDLHRSTPPSRVSSPDTAHRYAPTLLDAYTVSSSRPAGPA